MKQFVIFMKRAYEQRDEMVFVYLDESVPLDVIQRVASELWEYCCSMHTEGPSASFQTRRFVLLCVEVQSASRQTWLRNEFLLSKNSSNTDPYGMFVCGFKHMDEQGLQQLLTATILPCLAIDEALRELDNVIWRTTYLGNVSSGMVIVGDREQERELKRFFDWLLQKKREKQEHEGLREEKVVIPIEEIENYLGGGDLGEFEFIVPPMTPRTPSSPSATQSFSVMEVLSVHRPDVPSPLTSARRNQTTPSPMSRSSPSTKSSKRHHSTPPHRKQLPRSPHKSPSTPQELSSPVPNFSLWSQHDLKRDIKHKLMHASRITCVTLQGKIGSYTEALTADLMNDPDMQRSFTGGIYWIHCGKATRSIEILFQQHHLCSMIEPSETQHIHSIVSGKLILTQILRKKRALIILNDVHCYETLDAFFLHREPLVKYLVTTTVKDLTLEYPRTKTHEAYEVQIGNLTRNECELLLAHSVVHPSFDSSQPQLPAPVLELIDFFQGEYVAVTLLSTLIEKRDDPASMLHYLKYDCDMSSFDANDPNHLLYWKSFMLLQYVMDTHLRDWWNELLMLAALPQDIDLPLAVLQFIWEDASLEVTRSKVESLNQFGLLQTVEDEHLWLRLPPLVSHWIHILSSRNATVYHHKIIQRFEEYCTKETKKIRLSGTPRSTNSPASPRGMYSPLSTSTFSAKRDQSPSSPRGIRSSPFAQSNSSPRAAAGGYSPYSPRSPRETLRSSTSSSTQQDGKATPASFDAGDDLHAPLRQLIIPRLDFSSTASISPQDDNFLTPRSTRSTRFEYSAQTPRSPFSPRTPRSPHSPRSRSKPSFVLQEHIHWHKIDLSSFTTTHIYLIDYFFRFITYHLKMVNDLDSIRRIVSNYEFIYRKVQTVRECGEIVLDFERLCEEHAPEHSPRASNMYDLAPSYLAHIYQALKDSLPILQLNPDELPFQLIGRLIHLRGEARKVLHSILSYHKQLGKSWLYPFVSYNTGCTPSGRAIRLNELDLHGTRIKDVEKMRVTADSDHVVFMGSDSAFHFYSISKGVEVRKLEVNVDWNFDCSPDGKTLIVASYDKSLRRIDLKTGKVVGTFSPEKCKVISFLEVSPDGKYVFACTTKSIFMWSVSRGSFVRLIEFEKHVLTVTWDYSCEHLFVALNDATTIRVRATTGEEIKYYAMPLPREQQFLCNVLAFARNKKHLFSALPYANMVCQHSIDTGKCRKIIDCEHPMSLQLTDSFLILGLESGLIRLVSLHNYQTVGEVQAFKEAVRVQVTPDEQFVLAHTNIIAGSRSPQSPVKIFDIRHICADSTGASPEEETTRDAVRALFVVGNSVVPISETSTLVPRKLESGRELDVWKVSRGVKAMAVDLSFIAVAAYSTSRLLQENSLEEEVSISQMSTSVQIWDLAEDVDRPVREFPFADVTQMLVSASNELILFQSTTNKVLIVDHERGIVKKEISNHLPVKRIAVDDEHSLLLVLYSKGTIHIHNLEKPYARICEFATQPDKHISDVLIQDNRVYVAYEMFVECWKLEESNAVRGRSDKTRSFVSDSPPTLFSSGTSEADKESSCKRQATLLYTLHDSKYATSEITCLHIVPDEGVMVCGTRDNCVLVWELSVEGDAMTGKVQQVAHLMEMPSSIFCRLPYIVVGDIAGNVSFTKYLR